MSEDAVVSGKLQRLGDAGFEGTLERLIEHDRNAVWLMLTRSDKIAEWLAPGSIEPRLGGAVRIDFADSGTIIASRVLEFDPPRLLAYSWSSGAEPARPLRWELEAVGEKTRLTLTVRLPKGEDAARACAGFEGHLDMLAAALEGVPIRFPVPHFLAARSAYNKMLEG